MRKLILVLSMFLPNYIKILIYRNFFGWVIGSNVKIGFSLLNVKKINIKDNSKIGNFNIIKGIKLLDIGERTTLRNFNHIAGSGFSSEWYNSFIIGNNVEITNGHTFDVGGGITIGDNTTIAGMFSQIWSHEKSVVENQYIQKGVFIGSNVYIGSNALLAPGVNIHSNTVVGLGAVVPSKTVSRDGSLLVGNPAVDKKWKRD